MDRRKVYFHIGAHKTASSFLQANLRACRGELAARGLGVVLRRQIVASPFAQEVYEVSQGARPADGLSPEARANIRGMLAPHDGDVLVGNEDLVCRLRIEDFYQNVEPAARSIVAALDGLEVHFILYVRTQADYIESVFMQHVHLGRPVRFEGFLARAAPVDLSWLRAVEGLAAAVPRARIAVRPFEIIRTLGPEGFFRDFLRLCGVADPSGFAVSAEAMQGRAANRSYSELAMKIARRANPLLDPRERKTLRRFLQEHFSTATHPRAVLLSPGQRQEIFERYAASNRALFAACGPGADGEALGYY